MQIKRRSAHVHRSETTPPPRLLQMNVVITNGSPIQDAKLKFEFAPNQSGIARLWLVKLPRLKNADAFPRQVASGIWELRLEAVSATQPLQIHNYTPDAATQWLTDISEQAQPAPAELLILCTRSQQFTVTIHQPAIA